MSENVDLRVKRSQLFLKNAMKDLLKEKGLDAITVQDVADRAMVNRSTFYAHYQDKDDLFHAVVRDDLREEMAKKVNSKDAIGLESLRALAEVVFTHFQTHKSGCLPNLPATITPIILPVQTTVKDLLMEWGSPYGECQASSEGKMIATALSWTIVGSAVNWVQHSNGRQQTLEEALDIMMPMILYGVTGLPVPGSGEQ